MSEPKRIDRIWSTITDKANNAKIERDIIEVLKNVPIFAGLSNREIRNIASIAYQRHYSEGEIVIHEGQDSAGMYIIVEGEVKVTRELEDGTTLHLNNLGDGEFFGDVGLLDKSPRTATVTATRDCRIIGFFRPELLQLMDSDPKLASKVIFKLAQILAARFRLTHQDFETAQQEIDRLRGLLAQYTAKEEATRTGVRG